MITSAFFGKMPYGITLPKKAEVRAISGLPPHVSAQSSGSRNKPLF
jgi:hypothetical protein